MLNLYQVFFDEYAYCVFVFAKSLNRAKSLCTHHFSGDQEYVDLRGQVLEKKTSVISEMVIDCDYDEGYEEVTMLGYRFMTEDEIEQHESMLD